MDDDDDEDDDVEDKYPINVNKDLKKQSKACPQPSCLEALGKTTSMKECRAAILKWGFNKTIGACQEFTYGGCGKNRNTFNSMDECETNCVWHVCYKHNYLAYDINNI